MKTRAIKKPTPIITEDPELAAQTAREESFTAEEATWQGQPLHPYSSGREVLFTQLRAAAGAPPLREAIASTDDFFPDAIRVLYLCSHTPEEWREARAQGASAWLEQVEAWADDAIPLSQKAEAASTAMNILSAAYSGEHVPVARHGKTPAGKK